MEKPLAPSNLETSWSVSSAQRPINVMGTVRMPQTTPYRSFLRLGWRKILCGSNVKKYSGERRRMVRPLKILGPWQVTRICDSPDGARVLADELDLSPGLVSIVKKECNDPAKMARRTGALSPEFAPQTISGMLQPATTPMGQIANIADTVMNGSTMTHDNLKKTTSPYDATLDSLDDSEYSDYDQASFPDNYYSPTWVQPPSFSAVLLNPLEAMTHAVKTALNSRIAMKATEFGENMARKLLPDHNFEVTQPRNTYLDSLRERVEKYLEKQTKRTEIESKDEGSKAPASTSTQPPNPPPDKPIVEKQSDPLTKEKLTNREDEDSIEKTSGCPCLAPQKDTVNADSPNGTETHVGDVNLPEKAISGQSSDNIPITPPAFTSPQVPPESKGQQNSPTQKSVSDNTSQSPKAPQSPPLGLAEVAGPGTNNQLNTLTTLPSEGTRDKPETPDEAFTKQSSSSTQQNSEQKPPDEQNSTGNRTITVQGQFPAIDQLQIVNPPGLPLVPSDGKTPSDPHTNHMDAPSAPPPPPKVEDKKSNGAPNDQPNVQGIIVTPEDTPLKSQPSVNHNLRNQALTALVVVGIGIAALYIFNPQVRQWVFSQYVRIFHKASPQSTSDGTSTQPQQNSNASTQGYARVNDRNGVAFF